MKLPQGTLLKGRYRIAERIGRGGFGAIYLAHDEKMNRLCVVKENLDRTPEAILQFETEAKLLARRPETIAGKFDLKNGQAEADPGLPHIYEYIPPNGDGQFLIMEYIPGVDLLTLVEKNGPLEPDDALKWIGQVGTSLSFLHNLNPPLIHRDVKPANIRLSPEDNPTHARLIDFGLAKSFGEGQQTVLGARAISPGFSPPEQYTMRGTDERSDVYSLGATLYFLLTGVEPLESVRRMIQDTLLPPHALTGRVDRAVSDAVMRAMTLDQEKRYASIAEFMEALDTAKTGRDEVDTQRYPPPPAKEELPADALPKREPTKEPVLPQVETNGVAVTRPDSWTRRHTPAITFILMLLCFLGFMTIFATLYVNNGLLSSFGDPTDSTANVAAAVFDNTPTVTPTETPPPPTATETPSSTPTGTPSPTPTNTFTPTPSPFPTMIPPPTVTPLPPDILQATLQAERLFDAANALSTPPGNVILVEDLVIELAHDREPGIIFEEYDFRQSDFVIRAEFTNPYAAEEGDWDYGFFLRVAPAGERLSVRVDSEKLWELRYHLNELDTFGTIIDQGEIEFLNTGEGEMNVLMVVLDGAQGFLIINNSQIYPLILSSHTDGGTIRVATGLQPGHKDFGIGAVTLYQNLSIRDLTNEP